MDKNKMMNLMTQLLEDYSNLLCTLNSYREYDGLKDEEESEAAQAVRSFIMSEGTFF